MYTADSFIEAPVVTESVMSSPVLSKCEEEEEEGPARADDAGSEEHDVLSGIDDNRGSGPNSDGPEANTDCTEDGLAENGNNTCGNGRLKVWGDSSTLPPSNARKSAGGANSIGDLGSVPDENLYALAFASAKEEKRRGASFFDEKAKALAFASDKVEKRRGGVTPRSKLDALSRG